MSKVIAKIPSGSLVIVLIYGLIFVLMHPLFNYGYDDDFAYALSVKHLVVDHYFKITEWSAASLISQVWWGALFAYWLGFSFVTLHISVVVLFLFGLVAFYLTLRELELDDFRATIFSLALLGVPWVLVFTYTFMTDIPFLGMLMIALYFFVRGLQRSSNISLLVGSVVGGLSLLTRQVGVFMPLTVGFVIVLRAVLDRKFGWRTVLATVSASGVTILVALDYARWLSQDDHKTLAQIFNFEHGIYPELRMMWPRSLNLVDQTTRLYTELIFKVGFYLVEIIGVIWPLLLMLAPGRTVFKRIWSRRMAVAYLVTLGLVVAMLVVRPFSQVIWPELRDLHYPTRIFIWPNSQSWPWLAVNTKDFWDRTVQVGLLLTPLLLIGFARSVWGRYCHWHWRWRARLLVLTEILGLVLIGGFFVINSIALSRTAVMTVVMRDTWVFYSLLAVLLSLILLIVFGVHLKKFTTKDQIYLLIWLTLAEFFVATMLVPYNWEEYVIQFLPLLVIGVAISSKRLGLSRVRAVLIVGLLLIYSFGNAKVLHTTKGAMWEEAEWLVDQGVESALISAYEFSWYPWWYFESTFAKKYAEAGYNKMEMRVRTFTDPKAEDIKYNISFSKSPCGSRTIHQREIKTLFIHGYSCAKPNP